MAALLAVAAGLSLAGCASSRQAGVEGVAAGFYQAIAERDGEAACRLLAPATLSELEQSAGKPCAQAVVEEDIPGLSEPVDVTVFDTAARARVGSETAFLGQFRSGWRVVAAGCTPRSPRPYDCVLSGG